MSRPDFIDRVPPRHQKDWDIRGALNFIFGGGGGGLLAATALATSFGVDLRWFIAAGLVLVGLGLFAVWLKIGRPWRALNVVRRPSTSWMTREALIAPFVFAAGGIALFTQSTAAIVAMGVLGLVFAYAQGRILKANIGIPAWRRWSCVWLVVISGVAEGVGTLAFASVALPALEPIGTALGVVLVARMAAWLAYRRDLASTGAPVGTMQAFDAMTASFVWMGHIVPIALAAVAAALGSTGVLALAGLLAVLSGSWFKYVLVCKAAFTQGFALPRTPSRGKGKAGAGVQPGWQGPKP